MKKITLTLVLTLSISQAHAWGFDKKYASYPDPDEAQRITIKLGSQGSLVATGISYEGKFRLESVTGQSTDVFTISGPKIRKMGLDKFLLDCERNRDLGIFELAHDKENSYTLEGEVLPLNRSNIESLTGGLRDETIYTEVTTATPLDDSLMGPHAKSANMSARSIRRWIDPQIEQQKESIWETGRIKLDLTGKDAFVCDLLTKKTTLVMGTRLGFAKAMPVATPVITPQELRSVVEKMENRALPARSVRDGIAVNAILQNDAIKEVLNKDIAAFDVSNFLKVANALVDGNTGSLKVKSNDSAQVKKIARSLDTVEHLKQLSNVMVYPDVQVK